MRHSQGPRRGSYLHLQYSCRVSNLTSIPNGQSVIGYLQVKLLKVDLDHLQKHTHKYKFKYINYKSTEGDWKNRELTKKYSNCLFKCDLKVCRDREIMGKKYKHLQKLKYYISKRPIKKINSVLWQLIQICCKFSKCAAHHKENQTTVTKLRPLESSKAVNAFFFFFF